MFEILKKIYYFFKNLFVKKETQEETNQKANTTSSYTSAQSRLNGWKLSPVFHKRYGDHFDTSRDIVENRITSGILLLNIPRLSPQQRYRYSQQYMHAFRSRKLDSALAEITQDAHQEYVKMGHY